MFWLSVDRFGIVLTSISILMDMTARVPDRSQTKNIIFKIQRDIIQKKGAADK